MLEYILVLLVIVGIVIVAGRPLMAKLSKTFTKDYKSGFFADDGTGSGFYYYPVK